MAGQIARALAVFCVDEVVVFNDGQAEQKRRTRGHDIVNQNNIEGENEYTGYSDPDNFLMHVLSYLETPPHLRKYLFPMHPDLKLAGSLPSLDMPHHLRAHEWCPYREGVVIQSSQASDEDMDTNDEPNQTIIDSGLRHKISLPIVIPLNTRVTMKFLDRPDSPVKQATAPSAVAVAPSTPREEGGYYWGYTVRAASCISSVFTECPFDEGYDLTFGTSERGTPISKLAFSRADHSQIPEFNHMLVVFGGVTGLEAAIKADEELKTKVALKPEALFDFWINLCPGQGSRTIRTEEAVFIGLMGLRDVVMQNGKSMI